MTNEVWLIGRITKELELKKTPNGASVLSFVLAVNRKIKQEGQPDADFINCVAWNKLAEVINTYCRKGSQVGVIGRLQTRNYDDKDGKKVYITEVVLDKVEFLDTKSSDNTASVQPEQPQAQTQPQAQPQPAANYGTAPQTTQPTIEGDDLPF